MGQLRIIIGALDRAITAPDNKMTNVLTKVVVATGGPVGGTAAQRADWVLDLIRRHLVEVANGQDRREVLEAAEAARTPLDLNE
jgi:phage terminase Nu1 subunit (DNA packaging protein)